IEPALRPGLQPRPTPPSGPLRHLQNRQAKRYLRPAIARALRPAYPPEVRKPIYSLRYSLPALLLVQSIIPRGFTGAFGSAGTALHKSRGPFVLFALFYLIVPLFFGNRRRSANFLQTRRLAMPV